MDFTVIISLIVLGLLIVSAALLMKLYGRDNGERDKGFPRSRGRG